jgi:hypothetical protein
MEVDDIEGDVEHSKMVDVYTAKVVQLLNQFMDLGEILYGDGDVEGDLDAIFFNLVA